MEIDALTLVDKKIEELVKNKSEYKFSDLKEKVEEILKSVDIFFIDNQLNTKAVDLYLKNVISQRNNIQKKQERDKLDKTKKTKYALIESICKKHDFENQEKLIKKIEELEKKTNLELKEIDNSLL